MKIRHMVVGAATAGCAMGIVLPQPASAVVSDEDFNALKNVVSQLGEKVQNLEQTHVQDQKVHEQDQQQIKALEQTLGQTQQIATSAQQKADAAALASASVNAAPSGPFASHNFSMVGDAEVQFRKAQGSQGSFINADFAPIFLFRAGDNILYEAGFDFTLGNASPGYNTTANLSFATIDYLYNDYVTLVAGNMLLPLGTYSERSAGMLNKIPDGPLSRSILPGNGIGAQLRGSIPVGQSGQMVTYSVYGVNGPGTTEGTNTVAAANQIDLAGGNVGGPNQHGGLSGGGRIGWFYPWKAHYDLELGVSGQTGVWDSSSKKQWSAAVLDASLHLSPYFELKGEYIQTWQQANDPTLLTPLNFNPHGWWAQAGYKLSGLDLDLPIINNLELVGRYDRFDGAPINLLADGVTPAAGSNHQITAGFVYYFSNTLLFEGDYLINDNSTPNEAVFQLSYGF